MKTYELIFRLYNNFTARHSQEHKIAVSISDNTTEDEVITFLRGEADRFYPEISQSNIEKSPCTFAIHTDDSYRDIYIDFKEIEGIFSL